MSWLCVGKQRMWYSGEGALFMGSKELVIMTSVILAGAGIAGATALGSVLGSGLGRLHERLNDIISCIAAGIMLCAAMQGLVEPSVALCGGNAVPACLGIVLGALFLDAANRAAPRLFHRMELQRSSKQIRSAMFVLALAIHHFPEGLAAGVSFGTGELSDAAAVCAGIAIQNIPEAMIIMPAMAQTGARRCAGFWAAAAGGGMEILGLALGYCTVQITTAALPLLLAFAAGTMLFVIVDDIVPDTHCTDAATACTYGVLLGFCLMLCLTAVLEKWI